MSLAESITRAKRGDWYGNRGRIPGPGHGPNDRSLSIRDKGADDVLLHSFAGDDWQTVKDAWRADGTLPPRDTSKSKNDNVLTSYLYRDADGSASFRMIRTQRPTGKSFHAEHSDGRGGWIKGMNGTRPLPYRLPELLATHPDAIVYIVEGEKDADNLAALDVVATTNPNGAGKWRDGFSAYLKGRKCVVLPDNDAPGRDHAIKVSASLRAAGADCIIVELPGLPEKGDVSDWLAKGGDKSQLFSLATDAWDAPISKLTLPLIDPAVWAEVETPKREWALDKWIPAQQATYLTGAGGAGKSLAAQQLCTCTALGLPFMGVKTRQAVAIYLTCEDDADELHRRQKAICAALGVSLGALAGKLHLVSLAGMIGNELATFDSLGRMATTERYTKLLATVQVTKAGFVALDNVAHLFAGNENIRNQVAGFCGLLNNLASESNAAILFIGHPNKAGDSFSGSTAWENQVRSRLFLEVPCDSDGTAIDPDARTLTRAKANYARNGEVLAFRWDQWAFVRDEDLPADHRADMESARMVAAENEAFLACLAKATAERRASSTAPTAANYAPRQFAAMPTGKPISVKGFEAAMQRLLHLGEIVNGVHVYKRENRSWVQGIGLAEQTAPRLAPTPAPLLHGGCTKPHNDIERVDCTGAHALNPLYPTGK